MPNDTLYLCWTTTNSQQEAQALASLSVKNGLAACAQISGPIESFYIWDGETQKDTEYRISFKALSSNLLELEKAILTAHSYDTPQWITVEAAKVSEKYLKWAKETSNLRGFH